LALTGKQRRHLRALGHGLDPVAQIGKDGVSAAFVSAVEQALLDHELIKVRVGGNAELPRHEAAALLAARTGGEVAQVLGNTILLYRAHPDDPSIELP
jgi:RNA-binding protein